jgi:lysophospholipase L1-like esterase
VTSSASSTTPRIGILGKIGAASMAVVVSMVLCEIAARIMYPTPPEPMREPQIMYRADPEVGFIHVADQKGWQDDGLATINSLGLRGELPETPKPAGRLRVLAIGDSTTFGWGVADDETYVIQLERMLEEQMPGRSIDVINGGVGAYDLKHETRLLKHFAPTLEPDVVIVGLFWNDLPYELGSPDAASLPGAGSGAAGSSTPANANDRAARPFRLGNSPSGLNRTLRSIRSLYVLRHAWLAAIAPTNAADNLVRWEMALLEGKQSGAIDDAWKDIEVSLREIKALGDAGGFEVGVVIQPIRAQVEKSYPNAAYQTRVRAIAEGLGMFVIDPLPLFQAQQDRKSLFIPYDRMHFTGAGNAQVARAALDVLRARPVFRESPQH